jgi:predicted transcriptional regulator
LEVADSSYEEDVPPVHIRQIGELILKKNDYELEI